MPLGPDFESILQAARVGSEWAWERIYRDLSPTVLRYLRARGAGEPEDLLGEVFIRIVRSLPSFEGSEPEFRAWVFRCAHNALLDAWRKAKRRPVDYLPGELLAEGAGETESAETAAMRRLSLMRLRATLSRLSADQRDVILLRIIADLSIDEVAGALGKSPGAVKSLQARALAAIRREISKGAVSS